MNMYSEICDFVMVVDLPQELSEASQSSMHNNRRMTYSYLQPASMNDAPSIEGVTSTQAIATPVRPGIAFAARLAFPVRIPRLVVGATRPHVAPEVQQT